MGKIMLVLLTVTVLLAGLGYANKAGQPAQPGEVYGAIGTIAIRSVKVNVAVRFGATPETAKEEVYNEYAGTPRTDIEIVSEFKDACGAIAVPYGRDDFGWAVDKNCDLAVALAVKECSRKTDSACFRYLCSCSYGITP